MIGAMLAVLYSLVMFVVDLFKSRHRLEAENLFLRHQLSVAIRRAPPRLRLCGCDRTLLVWMTRLWPNLLGLTQVVQPETILRWHRAGFRTFWRWKSRRRAGRPTIDRGLRELIRQMSQENPIWGAPRIHGELLMLEFEVAQSTVSKYMLKGGPRSQGWKTFLRNHAQAIAGIDLCVVPTLSFERLFAFLVVPSENPIRLRGSPREAEASHDRARCSRSYTRSGCSSSIYSSRAGGLRPRICFCAIS